MEQGPCRVSPEDVYTDVHMIIAVLERQLETTWSRRIAHTLTGSTMEEIFPPLRHELCGLRRAPVARVLGLERRSSNRPGAQWERFGRPPNAQTGRLRRPNG